MSSFIIQGGHALRGEITPQGAKNEALQILCAVLLTDEPVTISNLPDIVDVNKLIDLLASMGVKTQRKGAGTWVFQADDVNLEYFNTEDFRAKGGSLRGSIMILGPMLGRFGVGAIPRPGGDKSVGAASIRISSGSRPSEPLSRTRRRADSLRRLRPMG